jgi:DNA-binding transcriptional ArsR family regulator
MPKYVRPATVETVEAAIETFGNRVRLSIIGYLADHPDADVNSIAKGIDAKPPTVHHHLQKLEDAGVVSGDPADRSRRNGVRTTYRRNDERLRELIQQLATAARVSR